MPDCNDFELKSISFEILARAFEQAGDTLTHITLTHIDPHWPTFIRWCLVLCTERSESFLALPRPLRSNCFDPGAATSETNARDLSLKLESSVQGCKCSGKAFSFLPRYYLLIFIMRSSHMDLVSTRPSDNICFDWSVFFPGFVEICGIKQCFWKLRKTNGDFTWYDDVGKFVLTASHW